MSNNSKNVSATMRVFVGVAIDVSTSLRRVLERLDALGKAVRPVEEDQLHVTLKFFGEISNERLPALTDGLDRIAHSAEPFDWSLVGLGAFPSIARPNIIWAGVNDGGRFAHLASEIEQLAESLGFAREVRPFHPHVTLARIKFRPPSELGALLSSMPGEGFGAQRAEQMVLFRSELTPARSIYTPLHVARL